MELLHPCKQLHVGNRSGTGWSSAPHVVAAPTHAQGLAQPREPVLCLIRGDKLILHGDSLAKYMAAGSSGESNTCLQYSRWRLKSQRLP